MASVEGSILYLEKDRLFFYDGSKIYKLDFTPVVVRDLDVLNEDSLVSLIFQFVDSGKFTPSEFIFVLSESVIFSNESTETDQGKAEAEFRNFTDLVPFDYVLAKEYKTERGIKMVATNAGLINMISDSFVQKGFTKGGVVPAMVFGQFGVRRGLDTDTAGYMLRNQELAKGKSMITSTAGAQTQGEDVVKASPAEKNKTLRYLIGGFILALLGLLALIFLRH